MQDLEQTIQRVWWAYRERGYSDHWIRRRLEGVATREDLTDEWHRRGIKESDEFRVLTEEVSRATFGVIPSEHKQLKHLPDSANLRDHMTELELIFSLLGEAATIELARAKNAHTLKQHLTAARQGGMIAGRARKALESKTGNPLVSSANFLQENPNP
jgi:DNA-damage-inducible protein D